MQEDKLHQLIKDKNEKLERHTLYEAEKLIDEIVTEQRKIAAADKRIKEIREELKALNVSTLDAQALLGE